MVLINNFRDMIDTIQHTDVLTLPALKQDGLKIEYLEHDGKNTIISASELPLPFASSGIFHANISSWRRLTSREGDCKAVYEVTFDVKDSSFKFKAGDTIGVIPHNNESDVDLIISHLDLTAKADVGYTLSVATQKVKIPVHVPVRSTIRYVLTYCVDLRSVLKKLFLLALSKHTKDENERRTLEYFCSKEGSTAYTTHILNKNLGILDIFHIFKSCKPPVALLLGNLPRLLPRPYSIVNSGLKNYEQIKICFSVMAINNRKGLTTGWLEKLILDEDTLHNQLKNLSIAESKDTKKIPIYLRNNMSQFCLPENLETPIVLIGPGTGVAPFIGFIAEREFRKSPEAILGETWLFFGCRDPELDFIYKDELNGFLNRGILNKLCVAFSRVEDSPAKYIQDTLKQNGKEVAKLIKDGASVYICGDLKTMATQVKEVLVNCLVDHGSTVEEAEMLIKEMQKDKRYLVDAWS